MCFWEGRSILLLALVAMIGAIRMHQLELSERRVQHEQDIDGQHEEADAATRLPAGQCERQQREDDDQQQEQVAVLTQRTLARLSGQLGEYIETFIIEIRLKSALFFPSYSMVFVCIGQETLVSILIET